MTLDDTGTVTFTAPCPCGQDATWINGLERVGELRRTLYAGGGTPPDMRPQVVTVEIVCTCSGATS